MLDIPTGRGPYPKDVSNPSKGYYPTSGHFYAVLMRMRLHVFRYIMRVSLIRLSPQHINHVWMHSNYFSEESDDTYDVLNSSMLETYAASVILIYVSAYACVHILTTTPIP